MLIFFFPVNTVDGYAVQCHRGAIGNGDFYGIACYVERAGEGRTVRNRVVGSNSSQINYRRFAHGNVALIVFTGGKGNAAFFVKSIVPGIRSGKQKQVPFAHLGGAKSHIIGIAGRIDGFGHRGGSYGYA